MKKARSISPVMILAASLAPILILGCASGTCRQLGQSPAVTASDAKPNPAPQVAPAQTSPKANAPSKTPKVIAPEAPTTVVVYKYDGQMQCEIGREIELSKMAKELTSAGIKVLKQEKRADGMMHIQVCGQPTGMTNSFSIPIESLKAAEKLGFRKWDFE